MEKLVQCLRECASIKDTDGSNNLEGRNLSGTHHSLNLGGPFPLMSTPQQSTSFLINCYRQCLANATISICTVAVKYVNNPLSLNVYEFQNAKHINLNCI